MIAWQNCMQPKDLPIGHGHTVQVSPDHLNTSWHIHSAEVEGDAFRLQVSLGGRSIDGDDRSSHVGDEAESTIDGRGHGVFVCNVVDYDIAYIVLGVEYDLI